MPPASAARVPRFSLLPVFLSACFLFLLLNLTIIGIVMIPDVLMNLVQRAITRDEALLPHTPPQHSTFIAIESQQASARLFFGDLRTRDLFAPATILLLVALFVYHAPLYRLMRCRRSGAEVGP